jgi:hypothetical protein
VPGCQNGCSFFLEEFEFSNILPGEQKELERLVRERREDPAAPIDHIARVLFESRRGRCVGGLLPEGETRASCKYFTQVPAEADLGNLVTLFTALHGKLSQRPWRIATFILGVFTLILSVILGVAQLTSSASKAPAQPCVPDSVTAASPPAILSLGEPSSVP